MYAEAITDSNFAINYNPNDARPYNTRGVAYAGQQSYNQAIIDLSKAIELECQPDRLVAIAPNKIASTNAAIRATACRC